MRKRGEGEEDEEEEEEQQNPSGLTCAGLSPVWANHFPVVFPKNSPTIRAYWENEVRCYCGCSNDSVAMFQLIAVNLSDLDCQVFGSGPRRLESACFGLSALSAKAFAQLLAI